MAMMKAVRMHEYGDIGVLRYEEIERPEPQAGEVLVRVRAAGINPVDYVSRQHPLFTTELRGLPYILGWDISGEVAALGAGVTQFAVGDEVYGMPRFPDQAGAYAEYTTAPVGDLALKPRKMTHEEAAAVPLAALTAWQALFDIAHLEAGQRVFITGASGGVGHYAVQLAKWKGAYVIATTSTRNLELVRGLGADVVVDYTRHKVGELVGEQVDVVMDTIGGDTLKEAFALIKRGGSVTSLPGHKGVKALGDELAPQYGVMFELPLVHPSGSQMAELARLADAGDLKTHLEAVLPLQEVGQAHKLSEGGRVRGKVVIRID